MSITKSYNKHTDTYYAYETSYVWDEKQQKKVQKKTCIGKFDPETGEVVPNAGRGRPSIKTVHSGDSKNIPKGVAFPCQDIREILPAMEQLEETVLKLARDFEALKSEVARLMDRET